jgi:hypothetical protein
MEVLMSRDSPWGEILLAQEFFYQRGRTDIIASVSPEVIIAFEVKLERWRDGIRQAYRNTCFAHLSYLILPEESAHVAARAIGEFSRHSVGLCVASRGYVEVVIPSPHHEPIQPWISKAALSETGMLAC